MSHQAGRQSRFHRSFGHGGVFAQDSPSKAACDVSLCRLFKMYNVCETLERIIVLAQWGIGKIRCGYGNDT